MKPSPLLISPAAATPPVHRTPNVVRIVIGLSPFERDELLAGGDLEQLGLASRDVLMLIDPTAAEWENVVRTCRPEVLVVGWSAPALPSGFFDDAQCSVRYVCFLTGSVRRLVPRSFIERGGWVTNWGDAAAPMVAEHALLLLLAALRCMPHWREFIDRPAAEQSAHPIPLHTRTLLGSTVAVHGFGQIARQLILLLAPLQVRVRAYSAGVPAAYISSHGAEPVESLPELARGARIFVECEALTSQTLGSVDASVIDLLARGAVFVNVGRGAVVNEDALARRARQGELQLALDVLETEPLPLDSPLRSIPGVILSPHIGGPTRDRLPDLGRRAVENLRRYLTGEKPQFLLTTEVYDRST